MVECVDIRGASFRGHTESEGAVRDLKRNQTKITYRLYLGKEEKLDKNGCRTGTFVQKYGEETELLISVSANKGDYSQQQFGSLLDYDRTMIISDPNCPIDENTRVYIGGDIYTVKAVARSLNAAQYAIKRADINENH